jgi:hypothetical protein
MARHPLVRSPHLPSSEAAKRHFQVRPVNGVCQLTNCKLWFFCDSLIDALRTTKGDILMRILEQNELRFVAGGDGVPIFKNNNGYGNGAEAGPPPGESGEHNPQLTEWNSGPKGPR